MPESRGAGGKNIKTITVGMWEGAEEEEDNFDSPAVPFISSDSESLDLEFFIPHPEWHNPWAKNYEQDLRPYDGKNSTYWEIEVKQTGKKLYVVATRDGLGLGLPEFLAKLLIKQTLVYQNYPNPFNPETWIPYQLSTAGEVSLRIYDVAGRLIRSLNLGHKEVGSYISKDKAAYWDGKNDYGDRVSSGIYFYELRAGKDFRAVKKMVILK